MINYHTILFFAQPLLCDGQSFIADGTSIILLFMSHSPTASVFEDIGRPVRLLQGQTGKFFLPALDSPCPTYTTTRLRPKSRVVSRHLRAVLDHFSISA